MCLFAWNGGNIVLQSRKALWDIEGEREGCWGDIDCRRACGVVRLRQAILPAYAEAVVSLTTSLFGPVASKTHRRGKFATPEQHFVETPLLLRSLSSNHVNVSGAWSSFSLTNSDLAALALTEGGWSQGFL